MFRDLVLRNRSYRRFYQDVPVGRDTLEDLVDLARQTASASNRQPLKYVLCCEAERNAIVFPQLSWAGYLKDWGGPAEGERPAAYIVILGDKTVSHSFGCDHGIAAQTILLGATEKGLGGCIIGSVREEELSKALEIPPTCEVLLVIALGRPREKVVIEPVGPDGDIRYWRDGEGIHHVPKRSLKEIILG